MALTTSTLSHLALSLLGTSQGAEFRERFKLSREQEADLAVVERLVGTSGLENGVGTWQRTPCTNFSRSGFEIEAEGLQVQLGANMTLPPGSYYLIVHKIGEEEPVLDLRISRVAGSLLMKLEGRASSKLFDGARLPEAR